MDFDFVVVNFEQHFWFDICNNKLINKFVNKIWKYWICKGMDINLNSFKGFIEGKRNFKE